MATSSGKVGSKAGSGHASNAALHDDEDMMARRGKNFRTWMAAKKKAQAKPFFFMDYNKSPAPFKGV